ncbi:MAG: hypothetical protein MJD61_06300 [Proteobacteria bacterium]|nr:hypothetical protein [Pseudomonadota bacterium]
MTGENPIALVAEVQTEYVDNYNVANAADMYWREDDTHKSLTVAPVFVPVDVPDDVWATCGMTFISPHFAVTAAHCVVEGDVNGDGIIDPIEESLPEGTSLWIQYLDINDNLAVTRIFDQAEVDGNWPSYVRQSTLDSSELFAAWDLCTITYRCSASFGRTASCPNTVPNNADIALMHCPNRLNGPWATMATNVGLNSEVEAWWFHEVLNFPPEDGTGWPPDRHEHYTVHPGLNKPNNYHYKRMKPDGVNMDYQLIPLVSRYYRHFGDDFFPYKVTSANNNFPNWDSDIQGACHGTSGSGVFEQNTRNLLGPVTTAGNGWGNPHQLCVRPDGDNRGDTVTGFLRPGITQIIYNSSLVAGDRP